MDGLIQQIAQIIEPQNRTGKNEPQLKPLKEIVLSGLSRGGFFKECPYLPEFDHISNNCVFLGFLLQNAGESLKLEEYLKTVETELYAAGVMFTIKEIRDGFRIETGEMNLTCVIIQKDFGLKAVISYQQIPIPYEIRAVKTMREGVRSEIQNLFESRIHTEISAEKKKKGASKSPQKNKVKTSADVQVMQLSLFDFVKS